MCNKHVPFAIDRAIGQFRKRLSLAVVTGG